MIRQKLFDLLESSSSLRMVLSFLIDVVLHESVDVLDLRDPFVEEQVSL